LAAWRVGTQSFELLCTERAGHTVRRHSSSYHSPFQTQDGGSAMVTASPLAIAAHMPMLRYEL
jgi:hypothetical protein